MSHQESRQMEVALQVVTFAELTFKYGKGAVISEPLGPVPC